MSDIDNPIYQLFAGMDAAGEPVAAFSKKQTLEVLIKRLDTFIEGGVSMKLVPVEGNFLPVDRYATLVEIGLTPYNISLHRDGYMFELPDLLGTTLDEPTIEEQYDHVLTMRAAELKNPEKQWGLGGTFWAPNSGLAIKKAKLARKVLFTALDIPFKSEQTRNRKKYTLQEVSDLATWFDYKLSTEKSHEFVAVVGYSELQIRESLAMLLNAARSGKGESAFNRQSFKELKNAKRSYKNFHLPANQADQNND